jgi:uncharacterized integral membrane protein
MLRRALKYLLAVPAAVILVTLAVINRHGVTLVLDPFRPEEPVLSLVLPFYVYLFGTLLIGIVAGGTAVWMAQARWRRSARRRAAWQAEAGRLARERDSQALAGGQLVPVNR